MSTRTQLRFVREYRDDSDRLQQDVRQVYKHSDGYPNGVLPLLAYVRDCGRSDPSYVASTFILADKLGSLALMDDVRAYDPSQWKELLDDPETSSSPWMALGNGVEDTGDIHGDEEYLYEVVTESPRYDGWHVRVSEHNGFPRWDENDALRPSETAWTHAEWQIEGSLFDVIDALDVDLGDRVSDDGDDRHTVAIDSESDPSKAYTVEMDGKRAVRCSCPHHRYRLNDYENCKHMDRAERTA